MRVVKENVGLVLVVVWVNHFEIFLCQPPLGVVRVDPGTRVTGPMQLETNLNIDFSISSISSSDSCHIVAHA
jgi:hypothetical protein